MREIRYLTAPIKGENKKIIFGIADQDSEIKETYNLRYKIYSKNNYLDISQFEKEMEYDEYDEKENTKYFIAKVDDQILAFVRFIQAERLPIHKAFSFSTPTSLKTFPQEEIGELGRLIVDRYHEDKHFPRNMILLFLIFTLTDFGKEEGIQHVYAFLKERLIKKLNKLNMPFSVIEEAELVYPKDGPMAPYFYSIEDPVTPVYFSVEVMSKYIEEIVHNKKLFKEIEDNHYILENSLYVRFLKTVGII